MRTQLARRARHGKTLYVALALAGLLAPLRAQTTWTNAGTGNWDTGSNWSTNAEPISGSIVHITNGGSAQVTTNPNPASGALNTLILGNAAGQSGNLEISGAGKINSVSSLFSVGENGTGDLLISGGGTLSSNIAALGNQVGSSGTAELTGAGSAWTTNYLDIGSSGHGELDILAGATVTVNVSVFGSSIYSFQVGNDSAASGSVLVSGEDSRLLTQGTKLGAVAGSSGSLIVEAAGAQNAFTASSFGFDIGLGGTGEFILRNGADAQTSTVTIGGNLNSVGTATATGAGTNWALTGTSRIGRAGEGDLTVENGAKLTSGAVILGDQASGDGTLTVTGAGSSLMLNSTSGNPPSPTGELTVGLNGAGELNILAGGLVNANSAMYVGRNATGIGTVHINGAPTDTVAAEDWNLVVQGNFNIGYSGASNISNGQGVVNIENGARVNIYRYLVMGSASGTTSELNIDGAGTYLTYGTATLENSSVRIGNTLGSDAVINVTNGADVAGPASVTVGSNTNLPGMSLGAVDGAAGTINIDGAGSTWTSGHWAWVGDRGQGTISITDGGAMTVSIMEIGRHGGADGAVTVSGEGSILTVGTTNPDPEISVGYGGAGSLSVMDGGKVVAGSISVARRIVLYQGGSQPENIIEDSTGSGEVTISGAGSRIDLTNEFFLGDSGHGELLISEGGVLNIVDGGGFLAGSFAAGGTGSTGTADVEIRGANSLLHADRDVSIGYNTTATLAMSAGGKITSTDAYLGRFSDSSGSAELTDADTKWTATGDFYLANQGGSSAQLTVEGAAGIQAGDELIVGLNGAADLWLRDSGTTATAARLFIAGRNNATGAGISQATVADGASLSVTGAARIFALGTLNIGEGDAAGSFSAATLQNDGQLHFEHTDNISFDVATSGIGDVLKEGSGRVSVGGNNTFSGAVTISQGILRAASSSALGNTSGATTVENGAALELAGGVAIGSENLYLAGNGGGGGALRSVSGNNTFGGLINVTIGSAISVLADSLGIGGDVDLQANKLVLNAQGNLALQGDIIGSGDIEKTGEGKVTVASATQYTGAFTVKAGELALNGSFNSASSVTVESGARLTGTGTAGLITLYEGAELAPGASPGTLFAEGLTWESGATLAFELGDASSPGNSDLLVLNGDLDAGLGEGPFLFEFTDGTGLPTLGATYTLITFDEALGFLESDFAYTYLGSRPDFSGSFVLNEKSLQFILVPEPGSVGLLALGSLVLLAYRKRKSVQGARPSTALFS